MKRREFIVYGLAGVSALVLASGKAFAQFGKLTNMMGGGGGDWKAIIKSYNDGLEKLGKQAKAIDGVINDLADALGLKQEAAVARSKAKDYEEGDTFGPSQMDAYQANAESTLKLVDEKLQSGEDLSAKQKKKMGEAAGKYAKALVGAVAAGSQLATAGADASKAGTPSVGDGMAAVKVAKDIPVTVPKAVSFVTNSVEAGQKLFAIMREKGVAVPDLEIDMGGMN